LALLGGAKSLGHTRLNDMKYDDRALYLPDTKDDSEFVVAVETRKQKANRQTNGQTMAMATLPSHLQDISADEREANDVISLLTPEADASWFMDP